MQDISGTTAHLNAIIQELQYQNTHLKKENQSLKSEILHLKNELRDNNLDSSVYENELSTLRATIARQQAELEEKEQAIADINVDIDRFNEEFDKILRHFELSYNQSKSTDDDAASFMQSDLIGQNPDLMFGIRVDDSFLHATKAETVKYYLYATGAYHQTSFVVNELKVKNRQELAMIGKALSLYFQVKTQDNDEEFIGLIEMTPVDIFRQHTIYFWGTDPLQAEALFESFSKQYGLFGELEYDLETQESA